MKGALSPRVCRGQCWPPPRIPVQEPTTLRDRTSSQTKWSPRPKQATKLCQPYVPHTQMSCIRTRSGFTSYNRAYNLTVKIISSRTQRRHGRRVPVHTEEQGKVSHLTKQAFPLRLSHRLSSAAQTAFCPSGITEAPSSGECKPAAICLWQGLVPRRGYSPDFWASVAISVPSGCVYGPAPKPWVPAISF